MGLIFWVDENKFLSDLVEKVFKKKGLEFYHLESIADFSFRAIDLAPEVIVLDSEIFQKHREILDKQFKDHPELKKYRYVIKGENLSVPFIENQIGSLPLPLDPFVVPERIESFLSNHSS